jgi:hypothetical protein
MTEIMGIALWLLEENGTIHSAEAGICNNSGEDRVNMSYRMAKRVQEITDSMTSCEEGIVGVFLLSKEKMALLSTCFIKVTIFDKILFHFRRSCV